MRTRRIPCTLLATLTFAGCTVGPDYRRPHVDMPPNWVSPTAEAPIASSQPSVAVVQAPVDLARWWTTFQDPVLESLIQRALERIPEEPVGASRRLDLAGPRTVDVLIADLLPLP